MKKSMIGMDKKESFSIRKFKVGVASVAIAMSFLGYTHAISADQVSNETDQIETLSQVSDDGKEDVSLPQAVSSEEAKPQSSSFNTSEGVVLEDDTEKDEGDITFKAADIPVAENKEQPSIAERTIRMHFSGLDESQIDQYGLWTWGGVETPSDPNHWPQGAQAFSRQAKDDFGYYIDVKRTEQGSSMGYLVLKNGEKVTETDQTLTFISPQMNEVWVTPDFSVYHYRPLLDEQTVRVHYKRDDNDYANWGLWLWGDTTSSENWPHGALDFDKVGPYGRYVDVPLSKALASRIGFLLVDKENPELPGHKSSDMAFDQRQRHSQLFLHNDEGRVYYNPYFIHEESELDLSKVEPGKADIRVTAQVNRPFHYNEHALLDVTLDNPNKTAIYKMQVDTSLLGGGLIDISPELNRVTLSATDTTKPGLYELPVRVYDTQNGYYETKASVSILPRHKKADEKDWDEQIIYFTLTDRFANGDKTNDNPYHQPYDTAKNQKGVYQGGDFRGLINQLDYIKDLGATAIWVTPIVENIPQSAGDAEYYGYHGYWASNFERLNPHLGTLDDFHELIDKAAEKGLNIIVDVVLNHSGYGTENHFKGLVRTSEENKEGDDQLGSLAGLPDFKTEDDAVRRQLVAWQSSWLKRSTTAKGNHIYGFRVDTVKHVDDTTWQHFKNELVRQAPDFHLIGESWGANYKDTKGDLGTGTMDSLLDFGFKDIAKLLVKGNLSAADKELSLRHHSLTSASTLGQFLSSHDEDGFLYGLNGNQDQFKLAATALLLAKGQPIIYYGEEIGQTGRNNWPEYDNRYSFDWSKSHDNAMLDHYKKVIGFRRHYSDLFSKGEVALVAGGDSDKWLLSKRSHADKAVYVVYSLLEKARHIDVEVSQAEATITDAYSGAVYQPQLVDGKWFVSLPVASLANGGTMLLELSSGEIIGVKSELADDIPIAEETLRLHFKTLPSENKESLGLWTWDDVEKPSSENGAWPLGALSFAQAKKDHYGYYLDVRLAGKANKIGFLINNTAGENLTGDKQVEFISHQMNEVWLDDAYRVHLVEPLEEGFVRVHYWRQDGNYTDKSLWIWGDVDTSKLGSWPDGINFNQKDKYGVYLDLKLSEAANQLGFLLLDESQEGDAVKIQPKDYLYSDLKKYRHLFLKNDDPTIYTNPYFVNDIRVKGVAHTDLDRLEVSFTTLEGVDKGEILEKLQVTDKDGKKVVLTDIRLRADEKKLDVFGDFSQERANYTLTYNGEAFKTMMSWQLKDKLYAYDGELGARVSPDGHRVDLTLWSPSADAVSLIIYDKVQPEMVIGSVPLVKGDKGQWTGILSNGLLGIDDYRGYYYHYEITRGEKRTLVLDPYAKSLAPWNSNLADRGEAYKVAKAAFVSLEGLGPKTLTYAHIPNFKQREDAIIYEAHVRDFTSDPKLAPHLKAKFGTFAAFAERLDYLKDLGVTHIQLLPILSYYFVNELDKERLLAYQSGDTNYNWGYDPQSYFALTGMYTEDPQNPHKRIEEFKNLVHAIHEKGMGVILDVVYNHTAKTFLFEDLEPHYYHFMEADGTAKSSYGGGRIGTTHYMSRRVLVDSVTYLMDTFKVDGFRFDLMGDLDALSLEKAFNEAKALNPNVIMLGEGWRTYSGDANQPAKPADQDWMKETDTVAVFSDDIRNTLKSGYPNEGQPAFITGAKKDLLALFANIKAQPGNFTADDPGDVIQYIAAHDNLTLFDVIAQSIKKDPSRAENEKEIHQRLRLGNLLVLTAQGTPFLHSGQEYGRTKQFKHEDYKYPVSEDKVPNKAHLLTNEDGSAFLYPYFIHDSYDASDAVNHFDWDKATDAARFPEFVRSRNFTKGLIALRKSTDAFRLATQKEIEEKVSLITEPGKNGIETADLVLAYQVEASNGDRYGVFINADTKERQFVLGDAHKELLNGLVLVDGLQAGITPITNPYGVTKGQDSLTLAPLTAVVLYLGQLETWVPDEAPVVEEKPKFDLTTLPHLEEKVPDDKNIAFGERDGLSNQDLTMIALSSRSEKTKEMTVSLLPKEESPVSQASEHMPHLPQTGDGDAGEAWLGLALLVGLGLYFPSRKRQ